MGICKYAPNVDCKVGAYSTNLGCSYCISHNYINRISTKIEDLQKPKTDCYFYQEDQDGPWCNYRHCMDPTCENCKAHITKKQVDAMIRKMVDNG